MGWGFAALANAPYGVLLPVDPAAAMPQPAQPKAGPTKRQQLQHNKRAASLGWGFAALAMCAPPPLAARHGRRAAELSDFRASDFRASDFRAFGLSGFRTFRASGLPGFRAAPCRFAALAPGHPEPAASAAAASVLFPVRFPARIRPASPSATAQEKESCWILLLLAPAAVGLRSARQCALRGLLLRWLLLLCHSRHGRRPGPQKDNNTAAQQKSCFFGVGLRCARQCALRGAAAVDPAAAAGLLEHRTFCRAARTPDLLPGCSNRGPLPGCSNRGPLPGCSNSGPFAGLLPLLLRPLPSASVRFPVPKLFIIVPFYAPPPSSFFAAAALLPPPLFAADGWDLKRNRRPRHNFPSCENRIFPFAFFNVFALAAAALEPRPAERLRRRWILPALLLEPDQPNACVGGGFFAVGGGFFAVGGGFFAVGGGFFAIGGGFFAIGGGMASSRCRRQATAAKTTAQEKESCWILLLLAPAAVGASLPLAAGHGEESFRASDFRASDFRASDFRAFGLRTFGLRTFGLRAFGLPDFPGFRTFGLSGLPVFRASGLSDFPGFRASGLLGCFYRHGGFCRRCCWSPTSRRKRKLLEPDQPNACGGGGFCRRCCWSPRARPAERLRQRGFCRRCCWSPRARPAERLRRRWILPPAAAARPAEHLFAGAAAGALEPDHKCSTWNKETGYGARPAERLRRRWILPALLLEPSSPTTNVPRGTKKQVMEPDQLNTCGGGGFCRRCCWSPRTRPQMFHVEQRNRLWSPTS